MKVSRKLSAIPATLTLLALLAVPHLATPQGVTSLVATARGEGTATVGQEVFRVGTVVVTLKEDGTGEIILVTEMQLFFPCSWSAPDDLSKGIDLKLTGGPASTQGSGKLFLRSDSKSIDRLSLKGTSKTKRKLTFNFVAK